VLALCVAYAVIGGDIVATGIDYIKNYLLTNGKGLVDALIVQLYGIGEVPANITSDAVMNGFLTDAARNQYVEILASDLKNSLSLSLPGMLLCASALTSVISIGWGNYLFAKRYNEQSESYLPVAKWSMPRGMGVTLVGGTLVTYILYAVGVKGFNTAFVAVHAVAMLAFKVQAVASFERRFAQIGMKKWLRILLNVGILLLVGYVHEIYGAFSALFGALNSAKKTDNKQDN